VGDSSGPFWSRTGALGRPRAIYLLTISFSTRPAVAPPPPPHPPNARAGGLFLARPQDHRVSETALSLAGPWHLPITPRQGAARVGVGGRPMVGEGLALLAGAQHWPAAPRLGRGGRGNLRGGGGARARVMAGVRARAGSGTGAGAGAGAGARGTWRTWRLGLPGPHPPQRTWHTGLPLTKGADPRNLVPTAAPYRPTLQGTPSLLFRAVAGCARCGLWAEAGR
jgi:hypothetical protein